MSPRVSHCALAVLAIVAISAPARGERVAVEAYLGARPADADRVLAPVRPVLERHGFVVEPAILRKRFASHQWQSGGVRTVGAAIFKDIELGIAQFSDVKVTAADQIGKGLARARANPIAWANEPKYREQVQRGLVYYALALELRATDSRDLAKRSKGRSQSDLLEKAATDDTTRDETMDELIRSSPSFAVSSDKFGSEGESLFQAASKRAQKNSGGSLELDVDDPNVVVYVNESVQPRNTTISNLTAGTYRVLVVSSVDAHEYMVDVLPNKRSRLVVKWDLDSILSLTDWVGFAYRTASDQKREKEFLSALVGASGVDVAATLSVKSYGAVEGLSYNLRTGKLLSNCTLARNSQTEAIEQFAQCLAGKEELAQKSGSKDGTEGAAVTAPGHSTEASAQTAANGDEDDTAADGAPVVPTARRRWLLWASLGSFGAAAVAGGLAAKFALDGRAAGNEYDRVCATMCTGQQAKAILAKQDTANRRAWISVGASGVATVGGAVLLFLWYRDAGHASAPTAQLSPNGATVGWAGTF